ncbi:hypothetical protein [Desertivirga arenae]|uniref:hypothetical protein n=1 Tax=Desertivirga arenae TaxID=2810309 RepID=UPI001A966E0E|nr:hypothetical protein [Pedobacter sp. SYSU D00823]
MVVVNKIKLPKELKDNDQPEVDWENPKDPEQSHDPRDMEQLIRQKNEAERRKNNLSEDEENTKED